MVLAVFEQLRLIICFLVRFAAFIRSPVATHRKDKNQSSQPEGSFQEADREASLAVGDQYILTQQTGEAVEAERVRKFREWRQVCFEERKLRSEFWWRHPVPWRRWMDKKKLQLEWMPPVTNQLTSDIIHRSDVHAGESAKVVHILVSAAEKAKASECQLGPPSSAFLETFWVGRVPVLK